jgi:hypothetical protein
MMSASLALLPAAVIIGGWATWKQHQARQRKRTPGLPRDGAPLDQWEAEHLGWIEDGENAPRGLG